MTIFLDFIYDIENQNSLNESMEIFDNSINILSIVETLQENNRIRLTEEDKLSVTDVERIISLVVNSSRDRNAINDAKNKMLKGLEAISNAVIKGEVLKNSENSLKKLISAINTGNKAIFGDASSIISSVLGVSAQIEDEEQKKKFDSFVVLGILAMLGTLKPNGMPPKLVLSSIINMATAKFGNNNG